MAELTLSKRQEIEAKESAARDRADGWIAEAIFVIPMALLSLVVWFGALMGMHYIETGSLY